MRRFVTFGASTLFLVAAAAGAARLAATAPTYTVEDLGTTSDGFVPTGVTGINDNGQVSGTVNTAGGQRPVRFTTGVGFEYLSGVNSAAGVGNAINANGEVGGYTMTSAGQRAYRAGLGSPTFVDPEPGGTMTLGWAINKDGVVAGYGNGTAGTRAFRAAANSPEVLPTLGNSTTLAFGINDAGQVTGSSIVAGVQHAFRANPDGTIDDIGATVPGASIGTAIDAKGDVVGRAVTAGNVFHAFRYYTDHLVDIDTLNSPSSNALAVSGAVTVGTFTSPDGSPHAFVHTAKDGMVDLNDRLPANSGWLLTSATGVNASGQIVGMGRLNGFVRAYRLTPDTPPDTTAPVVTGFTATPSSIVPPNGAMVPVTVSLTATDDVDPAPTCSLVQIDGAQSPDQAAITGQYTASVKAVGGVTYTLVGRCTDASGNHVDATTPVVVPPDTTPPVFTSLTATPSTITPANLATVTVTIAAVATDDSGVTPVCKLGNITGPGTAPGDYNVTGANTGTVKAVGGRTYTFNAICTDAVGNYSWSGVPVFVPPDTTAPAINSLTASPSSIWPPNNAMVPVSVAVAATDDADPAPACSLLSISGGTDADHSVTGQFTGSVRAVGGRTYTLTVGCTDFNGNRGQAAVPVSVVPDTTAPAITSLSATPAAIWPPNGKMVPVSLSISAEDDVDPSPVCTLSGIAANGGTSGDWLITGALGAAVRAEKNSDGTVRVYSLQVTCSDFSGNQSASTATVAVSKDGSAKFMKPPMMTLLRGKAIHRPGFARYRR